MKILIIDDKVYSELGYGRSFYDGLSAEFKNYFSFTDKVEDYIEKKEDFSLVNQIHEFDFIFLHQSYNSPLLDLDDLEKFDTILIDKLFTFSGNTILDRSERKISRQVLFKSLIPFIKFYKDFNLIELNLLFGVSENIPMISFLDKLENVLIDEGKSSFINHPLLKKVLEFYLYDYKFEIQKYSKMNEDEIIIDINEKKELL